MQAACGLAQLDKLDSFIKARKDNFNYLMKRLKLCEEFLTLPKATENSDPSWFGFLIEVVSDSKYVVDAINKGWLRGWVKKGFKDKKNPDLWRKLLPLLDKYHPVFTWVKGHNNHPQNERCDALAVEASKAPNLPSDLGYQG